MSYDLSHNAGQAGKGILRQSVGNLHRFQAVNIRVGRFDPDFGLEKATSSKWITAIERSSIYEIADWVNGHENGLGVQASSVIGNMAFMSGGVSAKDSNDTDGESVKQFNVRGVFAPMAEAGNVLHLGLNYATRDLDDTVTDARVRPRLTVRGVSTNGGNDAGTNGNRAILVAMPPRSTVVLTPLTVQVISITIPPGVRNWPMPWARSPLKPNTWRAN